MKYRGLQAAAKSRALADDVSNLSSPGAFLSQPVPVVTDLQFIFLSLTTGLW